jgi:tetratricopeptide (TPR) repeat protein
MKQINLPSAIRTFLATTALLLTCSALRAEPFDDLVTKGDAFDLKLQEVEALKCYLPAEKLQPRNASLLVRIARQYRHLVTDTRTNEDKLRYAEMALDYSRRAAALAPDDSETQLSVAISYGKMVPLQGKKQQVEASPRIREAAEKAIKLDPRNDLAWHVLGRWHEALADLSGFKRAMGGLFYGKLPVTTNEDAVKCFRKAMEINPNRLRNYIELGCTYAQMQRTEDARRFIEKGLAMANAEKDDPNLKRRGREVLASL